MKYLKLILTEPLLLISALVVALGLGGFWAAIGMDLSATRGRAEQDAIAHERTLSRSVEAGLRRTIVESDRTLRFLQASYRSRPANTSLAEWASFALPGESAAQVSLIRADGAAKPSAPDAAAGPSDEHGRERYDLSDREPFRIHLKAARLEAETREQALLNEITRGPGALRWFIQFTRPVTGQAGEGELAVSLPPASLSYNAEALRIPGAVVALISEDGTLWSRTPEREGAVGVRVSAVLLDQMREGTDRSFWKGATSASPAMLYVSRKAGNYPFYILVGFDESAVLAGWRQHRDMMMRLGTAISVVLVLGFAVLVRQAERAEFRRRMLRLTLDNVAQGIVMADRDSRLQIVNRRARELLELHGRAAMRGASVQRVLARIGSPTARPNTFETVNSEGAIVETVITRLSGEGMLLTATDVSAQREALAAEVGARRAAEEDARGTLTRLSREIRIPLNGVMGMAQTLQQTDLSDEQRGMCNTLLRSGRLLRQVLQELRGEGERDEPAIAVPAPGPVFAPQPILRAEPVP